MFIDDKLRKALVNSAERLGISASVLIDWARAISDEDALMRVPLELLLDGTIEVVEIRDQKPVFQLTIQGERFASLLQEKGRLASRPRGH